VKTKEGGSREQPAICEILGWGGREETTTKQKKIVAKEVKPGSHGKNCKMAVGKKLGVLRKRKRKRKALGKKPRGKAQTTLASKNPELADKSGAGKKGKGQSGR